MKFQYTKQRFLSPTNNNYNQQSQSQSMKSRRVEESREWFDDDNEDHFGYVECTSRYMTGFF